VQEPEVKNAKMDETSNASGPGALWASAEAYEPYVGRWSRVVGRELLAWLGVPAGARWLDVGCGTGALSQTILQSASPASVHGIDASRRYVDFARQHTADARASFEHGDAQALPVDGDDFDAVVSGLMLNFVAQPAQAVAEMARAARPGGVVAAYVWDYAGRMQFMRHFWNAAAALDPAAVALDEGRHCPLCGPGPLAELFEHAGLAAVEVAPIDIWTAFTDFDDYWLPFLGGHAPAPAYAMSLSEARRAALRDRLRASLPLAVDGSVPLMARAWAVRGTKP
jgi:SAM-dependent methyltransferase